MPVAELCCFRLSTEKGEDYLFFFNFIRQQNSLTEKESEYFHPPIFTIINLCLLYLKSSIIILFLKPEYMLDKATCLGFFSYCLISLLGKRTVTVALSQIIGFILCCFESK